MSSTKHWFTDCYRRNLVDMHIEDWDEEFLSEFSPEEYFANLKRAHIQAPMIYLQSHVGNCYFPTKVGHMHAALKGREDLIRRLVDLCRENGMKVVGYYSLIYNTCEEDNHPEWRMYTGADKLSPRQRGGRYGFCCPNNPEYREFVETQIREMAEYFTLDGMFYDMTFWPIVCECPHCMERYKRELGFDKLPRADWSDPDWIRLIRWREASIGEFARFVTETTRRYMPGVSVEHNYAMAVAGGDSVCGSTELVNEQCDYTGGDLYGDLYNHSFTAKYYYGVTKNQPFEYMTCRCDRTLGAHTVTKTEEQLSTEVMLTAAHHGASFIIDAIDPKGTLDSRVYDRIGRVFECQLPYEQYFSGELIADVGVYYATTGRYNSRGLNYNNKTCAINSTRTLIENHVPVGVVSNSSTGKLGGYKAVIAPAIAGISDKNRADLVKYVDDGGLLYISGVEDMALLHQLLGAELDGYTDETAVYIAPTEQGAELFCEFTPEYPLPTEYSLPIIKVDGCEVLGVMRPPYTKANERRFASIHSNPPGRLTDIPAIITKQVGKGRVIWSAAPIENDGRIGIKRVFMSLLTKYLPETTIKPSAPRQVELVSFVRGADILISAVDLLCSDELLPLGGFEISVKADSKPKRIIRLAGRDKPEREVEFEYSGGRVRFMTETLVMFDMYKIEF